MKDFNFAEKLAQRKEKAEAQAKKYFYDVKQRKAFYWAEGSTCDCARDLRFAPFAN